VVILYPVAFFILCRFLVGRAAEAGGPGTDGSLPAAIVAGALGLLTFLGPLWLTGPRALICRMIVFIALGGAIVVSYWFEAVVSGTFAWGFSTVRDEATGAPRPGAISLTAISIAYLLLLFAGTRLAMVFSAGRAAQFGLATLIGAAMIGSTAWLPAALKFGRPTLTAAHLKRESDLAAREAQAIRTPAALKRGERVKRLLDRFAPLAGTAFENQEALRLELRSKAAANDRDEEDDFKTLAPRLLGRAAAHGQLVVVGRFMLINPMLAAFKEIGFSDWTREAGFYRAGGDDVAETLLQDSDVLPDWRKTAPMQTVAAAALWLAAALSAFVRNRLAAR
jgi:hypothetical protein